MTSIHLAYPLVAFEGEFEDLTGGEYLGPTARPDLIPPGGRVTYVAGLGYFYDPKRRISGFSHVRVLSHRAWERV